MNRALILAKPCLIAAAVLTLSGCETTGGSYPSLARRDAERITGSAVPVPAEPVIPATPAPPGAELSVRLARLVEQAQAAHSRFNARRGPAERLIAAGGGSPVASEGWAVASVALAGLESARSEAIVALAELDALHAEERLANYNAQSGDGIAIAASRDQVLALVGEEDRVLTALRGRLGG